MSAERELERASKDFWLATGGDTEVIARAERLAGGDWCGPVLCGLALLTARAERRWGAIDDIAIDNGRVRIEEGADWWTIRCDGASWIVESEREVWSKDSRTYETVTQQAAFDPFGGAFRHVRSQTRERLFDGRDWE